MSWARMYRTYPTINTWYVLHITKACTAHTHSSFLFLNLFILFFCIISFSTSWINICNHKCVCVYVYSLFKNGSNLLGVSVKVLATDKKRAGKKNEFNVRNQRERKRKREAAHIACGFWSDVKDAIQFILSLTFVSILSLRWICSNHLNGMH